MKFLFRYSIKAVVYFLILWGARAVSLLPGDALTALWVALVLAAVNMVVRPITVAIALPFNIITVGIASVFANLLCLVIAEAITGALTGFWAMLLVALVIMLADDGIRGIRAAIRARAAA